MLIYEFRIILPLTTNEYKIGQLFTIIEISKKETGGGEGIQVLKNEPISKTNNSEYDVCQDGQFTHKIYHLNKKIPNFIRLIAPKECQELEEKSWNCFPHCKTIINNPKFMKDNFELNITSLYLDDDRGDKENILNLNNNDLRSRKVVFVDISDPKLQFSNDYVLNNDPLNYHSIKTGRGPLIGPKWWTKTNLSEIPIMCAYKLVKINFKWLGVQSKVERLILEQEERIFLNFHRQLFCSMDKWFDMTLEDIRKIEDEVKIELDEQRKNGSIRGMFISN